MCTTTREHIRTHTHASTRTHTHVCMYTYTHARTDACGHAWHTSCQGIAGLCTRLCILTSPPCLYDPPLYLSLHPPCLCPSLHLSAYPSLHLVSPPAPALPLHLWSAAASSPGRDGGGPVGGWLTSVMRETELARRYLRTGHTRAYLPPYIEVTIVVMIAMILINHSL